MTAIPAVAFVALAMLVYFLNERLRWRLSDGWAFLLILGVWTGLLWTGMLG